MHPKAPSSGSSPTAEPASGPFARATPRGEMRRRVLIWGFYHERDRRAIETLAHAADLEPAIWVGDRVGSGLPFDDGILRINDEGLRFDEALLHGPLLDGTPIGRNGASDVDAPLTPELRRQAARHRWLATRTEADLARLHGETLDQCLQLLTAQCIELVLWGNLPHEYFDSVLRRVADHLGIPSVVRTELPSGFNSVFVELDGLGRIDSCPLLDGEPAEPARPDLSYMKGTAQGFPALGAERAFHRWTRMVPFARRRLGRRFYRRVNFEHGFHRSFLDFRARLVDLVRPLPDAPYVYFPLHLQPEMTTNVLGGEFDDQVEALERLRDWMPDEVEIVVKENPNQGLRFPWCAERYYRDRTFFERLGAVRGVTVVDPATSSAQLVHGSVGVATITGTAGLEAVLAGQPALVFGHAWYRSLSGVTEWAARRSFAEWRRSGDGALSRRSYESFLAASLRVRDDPDGKQLARALGERVTSVLGGPEFG